MLSRNTSKHNAGETETKISIIETPSLPSDRIKPADDSSSESSEESSYSDEGTSEFAEVLRYFTRNEKAVEFS